MKKLNLLSIILLVLILASGCKKDLICKKGSGGIATKALVVPSFSGIDLFLNADVFVTQGSIQEVLLEGDENVIESIGANVKNGKWQIEFLEKCFKNYHLTITITLPIIDEINVSGSGNVNVHDFININTFNSTISGSGVVSLNKLQSCQILELNISGSGEVIALDSSQIENLSIDVSGSGNIDLFLFQADNCVIDVSGSGDAEVFVNNALDVDISGSGEVSYKGFPVITSTISGSGELINEN